MGLENSEFLLLPPPSAGTMSEALRRYLPLPDIVVNRSEELFREVTNRTVTKGLLGEVAGALTSASTPIAILFMIVLLAIAALFFAGVWYGKELVGTARQYVLRRVVAGSPVGELVEYIYPGIKLVLRRYYLKIRDAVGCRRCTPREIVTKCGRVEYEEFAKLYEDVVYGSKELTPEKRKLVVSLGDSV